MARDEFTEGQVAIIKNAAAEAVDASLTRMEKIIASAIELHGAKCPIKDKVDGIVVEIKERHSFGKGMMTAIMVGITVLWSIFQWIWQAIRDSMKTNG